MAYNKITLNGETKIDLTQDTVTAEDVVAGKTFHLNSGETAVGTLEVSSGGGDVAIATYGVSWVNDDTTTMTRTDDAVGMTYSITDGKVTSDFDKVFPYNEMKRKVINGNTFVFVPAMWFRVVADSDNQITSVAVSSVKGKGDNWYPTRPFYYGAYAASSDGTILKSVSGETRLSNITRAEARTRSMATGEKYHQRDLYAGTILMFLWWIEFATKNSQSVMSGSSKIITTGGTDSIYNEEYGDNFCVSGYAAGRQMVWHGIEDYIGGIQEWEDGMTSNGTAGGDLYASDVYTLYDDYSNGSKMTSLSYKIIGTGGTLMSLGWDETKPFLCLPISTIKDYSYTKGFCDYASQSGVVLRRGTYDANYGDFGVNFFGLSDASNSAAIIGCRLLLNV